jgi:hypothetical protein
MEYLPPMSIYFPSADFAFDGQRFCLGFVIAMPIYCQQSRGRRISFVWCELTICSLSAAFPTDLDRPRPSDERPSPRIVLYMNQTLDPFSSPTQTRQAAAPITTASLAGARLHPGRGRRSVDLA